MVRYEIKVEAWNGLTTEDKDKIIDFWELEQAANDRV